MVNLNLPSFDYKIKHTRGKVWIFDGIRKKYVVLTPEEWVRQHVIEFLVNHLMYPKSLIRVEYSLVYNTLSKRSDVVVFNRSGNPWMVVECKAPEVKLNDQTARQISVYNQTLNASYLVVTNGLVMYCFNAQQPGLPVCEMPQYPGE